MVDIVLSVVVIVILVDLVLSMVVRIVIITIIITASNTTKKYPDYLLRDDHRPLHAATLHFCVWFQLAGGVHPGVLGDSFGRFNPREKC